MADRPVRLILTNGFLGAGKTTALSALAAYLRDKGLRVGVITNDQAAQLVDTALIARQGLPVAEVAGGCFCCRFTDLLEAAQEVMAQEPDVLLCEPVGSCTDMVATVLAPLKHFHGAQFEIAPFSVLVDPGRVRALLLHEQPDVFPPEVGYIFHKQLEEADEILLTKADTLSAEEATRYGEALKAQFGKPVSLLSARRGDGIAAWAERLMQRHSEGRYLLREIDYDTYAQGEAVLGWLNATLTITGDPTFAPSPFVQSLLADFQRACRRSEAEIAHVKLALAEGEHLLRANLISNDTAPDYGSAAWEARQATLILNARVRTTPENLEARALAAVQQACLQVGAASHVETLQSFCPGYPRPPHRLDALV